MGDKGSVILWNAQMFCYLFTDSYHFLMFKGFNFILFYANSLIIRFFFVSLPREQKVIVMEATVFNPLQIHLLQMFALDKSQNGLKELKDVLYRHYSTKMEDRLDALWQSGKLNQERLDEINEMDLHKLK